ncbi:hypothetical protein JCM11491_001944 [Sporobolomyces phaffii]
MSKYAALPDIDVSGADVFETPDLPPQHTYSGESDSEDEYLNRATSSPATQRRQQAAKLAGTTPENNINGERLDAKEARERFGRVEAERNARSLREDDSRRARRRLPPTDEYVLEDEREKESPLERLRRLRSEVAELEDEVRRSPAPPPSDSTTGSEDAPEKGKGKKREISAAVILQQLQMLRGDLQGLEPRLETGVLEGTGENETAGQGEFASKAKATLGLLGKLGQRQASEDIAAIEGVDSKDPTSTSHKYPGDQGELESRLSELEKLIGATEADIDDSHSQPVPLLPTLSRLEHLLTLLTQPRHLDSISRRVKVLTSDLERIHESRRKLGDTRPLNVALQGGVMTLSTTGGTGPASSSPALGSSIAGSYSSGGGGGGNVPPDALQKIDSLFSLLPRLDPLLPLAPRLLTRLRSLQTLHQSSTAFSSTLTTLQGEVAGLSERRDGLEQVLTTLEQSFQSNQERFEGNLKGLETRLEGLGKRLDDLNR